MIFGDTRILGAWRRDLLVRACGFLGDSTWTWENTGNGVNLPPHLFKPQMGPGCSSFRNGRNQGLKGLGLPGLSLLHLRSSLSFGFIFSHCRLTFSTWPRELWPVALIPLALPYIQRNFLISNGAITIASGIDHMRRYKKARQSPKERRLLAPRTQKTMGQTQAMGWTYPIMSPASS